LEVKQRELAVFSSYRRVSRTASERTSHVSLFGWREHAPQPRSLCEPLCSGPSYTSSSSSSNLMLAVGLRHARGTAQCTRVRRSHRVSGECTVSRGESTRRNRVRFASPSAQVQAKLHLFVVDNHRLHRILCCWSAYATLAAPRHCSFYTWTRGSQRVSGERTVSRGESTRRNCVRFASPLRSGPSYIFHHHFHGKQCGL